MSNIQLENLQKNNDGVGRVPIYNTETNEMSYLDLEDGVGGENVETIEFNDQTYTKDLDGDFLNSTIYLTVKGANSKNCSIKLPTSAKEDDQITIIQGTHHVQNYNSFVVVAEKPSSSNPVILTSFTRNVSIVKCHFNGVEWDTYSVDRVDVIDNFTSSIPSTALSSNKGRELNEKYIEEKSNREAADAKLKDLIDKSKGKGKDDPHKFDQFVKINDRPGAGVVYDQSSMQKRSASYAGASITTTKGVDDLTFDAGTRNVDYPRFTTDSATTKVRVKDFADFKLCIDSTFYHGRMDIEHPITTKSNTFYTFDIYIDGLKPSRIDITSYDGPSGSTFKEFSHTHWFYSNTKTNLIHVVAVADSTTTVQGTMDVSLWFDTVGGGSCKTITGGYVTDLIEVPLSDAFTYQDAVHNKIPFHDKVNEFRGYTKEVGTKLATANNDNIVYARGIEPPEFINDTWSYFQKVLPNGSAIEEYTCKVSKSTIRGQYWEFADFTNHAWANEEIKIEVLDTYDHTHQEYKLVWDLYRVDLLGTDDVVFKTFVTKNIDNKNVKIPKLYYKASKRFLGDDGQFKPNTDFSQQGHVIIKITHYLGDDDDLGANHSHDTGHKHFTLNQVLGKIQGTRPSNLESPIHKSVIGVPEGWLAVRRGGKWELERCSVVSTDDLRVDRIYPNANNSDKKLVEYDANDDTWRANIDHLIGDSLSYDDIAGTNVTVNRSLTSSVVKTPKILTNSAAQNYYNIKKGMDSRESVVEMFSRYGAPQVHSKILDITSSSQANFSTVFITIEIKEKGERQEYTYKGTTLTRVDDIISPSVLKKKRGANELWYDRSNYSGANSFLVKVQYTEYAGSDYNPTVTPTKGTQLSGTNTKPTYDRLHFKSGKVLALLKLYSSNHTVTTEKSCVGDFSGRRGGDRNIYSYNRNITENNSKIVGNSYEGYLIIARNGNDTNYIFVNYNGRRVSTEGEVVVYAK